MDQFVLFGDSITQQSFSPHLSFSFGTALSYTYTRRLDVVNRGFSGFNTTQALHVLPQILPSPTQARVRILCIFFGANDARLPNTASPQTGPDQHTPIKSFKANLRAIVQHAAVQAHKDIHIMLVTPPPIEERKWSGQRSGNDEEINFDIKPNRKAESVAEYATAVRELGDELNVAVLDLHRIMISNALGPRRSQSEEQPLPGSMAAPQNPVLREYMRDGLHFSGAAYRVLFDSMMQFIESNWPDQLPQNLPKFLLSWDDTTGWEKELREHEDKARV